MLNMALTLFGPVCFIKQVSQTEEVAHSCYIRTEDTELYMVYVIYIIFGILGIGLNDTVHFSVEAKS